MLTSTQKHRALAGDTAAAGRRYKGCITGGVAKRQRGMTLIELMIVVAIIGIIATIAVFMFRKSTKGTQIKSEVAAMFAEIQLRQEAFYLENGVYASSGADETDMHPSTGPSPGLNKAESLNPMPAEWTALGINPDKQSVYCTYVTVAGLANDDSNIGTIASSDFGMSPAQPPIGTTCSPSVMPTATGLPIRSIFHVLMWKVSLE